MRWLKLKPVMHSPSSRFGFTAHAVEPPSAQRTMAMKERLSLFICWARMICAGKDPVEISRHRHSLPPHPECSLSGSLGSKSCTGVYLT